MKSSVQPKHGADTARGSRFLSGGASIFCVLASLFVTSQFLRVSNAIVAPELMADLHLTASEMGLLGSGFFYSFAAVQIPLGWALDRFGPRVMVILVPLLSVVGLFVFSVADSFALAFLEESCAAWACRPCSWDRSISSPLGTAHPVSELCRA